MAGTSRCLMCSRAGGRVAFLGLIAPGVWLQRRVCRREPFGSPRIGVCFCFVSNSFIFISWLMFLLGTFWKFRASGSLEFCAVPLLIKSFRLGSQVSCVSFLLFGCDLFLFYVFFNPCMFCMCTSIRYMFYTCV